MEHELGAGHNASAWTITALAVRLALAMNLNDETANDGDMSFVEREQRCRMMWAAYACDSMCHGGLNDFVLLPITSMRIPLPASEHHYSLSIEPPTRPHLPSARESPQPLLHGADGMMSRYARLMSIRTDVLK